MTPRDLFTSQNPELASFQEQMTESDASLNVPALSRSASVLGKEGIQVCSKLELKT